jgi:uncharacterized membrane protein
MEEKEKEKSSIDLLTIALLVCWSVSLATYQTANAARTYAIIDLVFCCIAIVCRSPGFYQYAGYVLYFFGLGIFYSTTGKSMFAGFDWGQNPLLIQILFFDLWVKFIKL